MRARCGFLLAIILASASVATPASSGVEQSPAQAQGARTFDELERSIGPQDAVAADLQIRVRWRTVDPVANPAQTINQFELTSVAEVGGTPAPRWPRLHGNSMVVVSENREGRALAVRVITDPRAVRSESPQGRAPVLRGETLYYLDADLLFVVPSVADTARIRFFKPRIINGVAVLDELGAVDVR